MKNINGTEGIGSASNDKFPMPIVLDDELATVVGGMSKEENMCACGRGKIVKNGKCKHCNDLEDLA